MNKKKILGLVVLLAIVCVSGTVYASQLLASSISFTPSKENKDKGFVASNVEEALNQLYKKTSSSNSDLIGDFNIKSDNIKSNEFNLDIDDDISKSDVKGYVLLLNGKVKNIYDNVPIDVKKIPSDTKYKVEIAAIDINGNLKKSSSINVTTPTMDEVNLNLINLKKMYNNGYKEANYPQNAIDGNMTPGNGRNWYGGTKLLLDYENISTISAIGVYTTENWGYSFSKAKLYYSDDDSLTLDSDLSKFPSITVDTEKDFTLSSKITAKRIMLVKESKHAVYEFKCMGIF